MDLICWRLLWHVHILRALGISLWEAPRAFRPLPPPRTAWPGGAVERGLVPALPAARALALVGRCHFCNNTVGGARPCMSYTADWDGAAVLWPNTGAASTATASFYRQNYEFHFLKKKVELDHFFYFSYKVGYSFEVHINSLRTLIGILFFSQYVTKH